MKSDIQVMQTMVDTMVGIPLFSYPARQNGAPKPKGEFAHIRLIEEYPVSVPAEFIHEETPTTITYRHKSLSRLRYRIGIVDTDGLTSVKIKNGWNSHAMKALMISSGYGFIRVTPLSNEDAKLEREWEYRIGFAVEMYVTRVFEETVGIIETLEVNGTYVSPGLDEYLINFTINE